MKLLVDGGGYTTARTAFEDANHVAALQHDTLTGKLAGYAGMAGDDSSSAEFSAAYDDAAAQATGALADLVSAFATLGHLTEAARANHRNANVASIIGGAAVYDGDALPEGGYVSVRPTTPPSAFGGGIPDLPFPVGLLVDAIDGFVWPSADVDRHRDAAHTWRSAAESLEGLRGYCAAAVRAFDGQRSPEIPVAIDAITELDAAIDSVADEYAGLAVSCDSFAATVEEKRREMVDLGLEVLRVVAEEVALAVGLGLVTAGVGAMGKGALAGARIAAYAPRFAAILAALRAAGAATATTLRAGTTALRGVRSQLAKYVNALRKQSAARGEAGSIRLLPPRPRGWLRHHEHSGSHTLERHVGKSDAELLQRLRDNPSLPGSSSFPDQRSAERAVDELLTRRADEIDAWQRTDDERLFLEGSADRVVGRFADPQGHLQDVRSLRVFIVRDDSMSEGFRIVTAYPKP